MQKISCIYVLMYIHHIRLINFNVLERDKYCAICRVIDDDHLWLMSVCTDTSDGLLVTATVPVVDRFGWTTSNAAGRKHTSQTVDIKTGAVTTANTEKMSPLHASVV